MTVVDECREFARMLQCIKLKSPEVYRHIVGLIKFFFK
jgi:hypothetical protein